MATATTARRGHRSGVARGFFEVSDHNATLLADSVSKGPAASRAAPPLTTDDTAGGGDPAGAVSCEWRCGRITPDPMRGEAARPRSSYNGWASLKLLPRSRHPLPPPAAGAHFTQAPRMTRVAALPAARRWLAPIVRVVAAG